LRSATVDMVDPFLPKLASNRIGSPLGQQGGSRGGRHVGNQDVGRFYGRDQIGPGSSATVIDGEGGVEHFRTFALDPVGGSCA